MANIAVSGVHRGAATPQGSLGRRAAPSMQWAGSSDAGCSRSHNEDSWRVLPELGLLVLADGMGGYNAGEVASALAVDTLAAFIADDLLACEVADPLEQLAQGISAANASILAAAARRPECLGMGTTLAAAWASGGRLRFAHVGDSRIYLWRGRRLTRLTRDHSVRQAMIDAGVADADTGRQAALCGVLTRALGVEPSVEPDCGEVEIEPGDRLLVCSDGLTDLVPDAELAAILGEDAGSEDLAARLIGAALRAGGFDNVTALVARFEETGALRP